jgi:MFS family permease
MEDPQVPGTEVMDNSVQRRFVPQPSAELDDPLNWSKGWKFTVISMQGIFVLVSVVTNLSIAPLTPIYMAEWGKSQMEVALLTGVCVLSLGYANFVIVPCAESFGRRPITIICVLWCLGADIWQASAKSYGSFLGARIFTGFGAAANESILVMVIADMFFLHERGKYMAFYFFMYFNGLFLGPIISGAVAQRTSWRWFFWACTIAQGINFIGLLFLFPETRFRRSSAIAESESATKEQVQVTTSQLQESNEERKPNRSDDSQEYSDHRRRFPENAESEEVGAAMSGGPVKSQFACFQPMDKQAKRTIVRHVFTPVQLFFYPIVLWAAVTMGGAANALLAVNILQSQSFAAPPYNMSPQSVGFANFALVVGGTIGLATVGPFSDWMAARLTKNNQGVREPEMRLWSLIPFLVFTIIGLVVVGAGWQLGWPWEPIIIVGFSLVGLTAVSVPTISVTYAVDCYKPVSGQIMTTCTVFKNTFGFAMTYFINDLSTNLGPISPVMLLMAITVGPGIIGIVGFLLYGKTLRKISRNSKFHNFD